MLTTSQLRQLAARTGARDIAMVETDIILRQSMAELKSNINSSGQLGLFQREAKYLIDASSAGHGTSCVSVMLRDVPLLSSVRRNGVQSRPASAHS
jgi:hypothetical protein